MKRTKRIAAVTVTALLTVGLTLNFSGCSKDSTIGPAFENDQASFKMQSLSSPSSPALGKTNTVLAEKVVNVVAGQKKSFKLNYSANGMQFTAKMVIKKGSVNNDGKVKLTLEDDKNFVGMFSYADGYSNLALSKKSKFNISITGADLDDMAQDYIAPYYHDPYTGLWSEMSYNSMTVDIALGSIEVKGAKMPDFGRFALYNPQVFGPSIITAVTKYIDASGGELINDYKGYEHGGGPEEVKTTFKVMPNSISEDAWINLALYSDLLNGYVDTQFLPHGIEFSEPCLLTIEAKNLDLSGWDENAIEMFYVDENGNQLEEIEVYDIIIKPEDGYIKIINAELHHFSRYALAHSE